MVHNGRHILPPRFRQHGAFDDPRPGLPLLRPRKTQECTEYDMGMHGFLFRDNLPVVFLGLQFGVLQHGDEWIHWQPEPLRYDEDACCSVSGKSFNSRTTIRILPGMFTAPNYSIGANSGGRVPSFRLNHQSQRRYSACRAGARPPPQLGIP